MKDAGVPSALGVEPGQLNSTYTPRTSGSYTPSTDVAGAGSGGGDLLGGGAGLQFTANTPDAVEEFRFTGPDEVVLQANAQYVFELWPLSTSTLYLTRTVVDTGFNGEDLGNLTAAAGAATYNSSVSRTRLGGGVRESLMAVYPAVVGSPDWTGNVDNNWSTPGNWADNAAPNGVDAVANFGSISSGRYAVNLDTPRTVGTLNFNSTTSYTLSGGTITMQASSGAPSIVVTAGTHTIASPLTLNNYLFVTTASGTQLDVTGPITATVSGQELSKSGGGVLQIEQVNIGTVLVNAGTLRVSAKATPNSPSGTVVTQNLVINGGSMDLTNNSMVIDYTAAGSVGTLVSSVRTMLQNGTLTSSSADAAHKLGYGDNAVLGKTTFAGVSVTPTNLLVKYTWGGDANLDGQVDVTDLGALATNWQTSAPWTGGDFNYDGFVDVTDLGILATNWQQGVGSPLGPGSFRQALAAFGLSGVSVPEPTTLGLLAAGLAVAFTRRRRSIGNRQSQITNS